MSIQETDIANFLKISVEPLNDTIYGNRYRAAAYLTDGTYLPCVVFQSEKKQVELFQRRMKDLESQPSQKRDVAAVFVAAGSRVNSFDLQSVEPSPYAWPLAVLKTIQGETAMGWTAFVAEMRDGTMYSYGSSFRFEFFDLPEGYAYGDIAKIHSGMVYSESKGLQPYSFDFQKEVRTIRERPFFTCYLKALD
jgi:hypothetical protein